MFSSVEQMRRHFGEIDEYMVERIDRAEAARGDRGAVEALVAEVRADGYERFADKLAELAK